ncbi:1-deoxyxylulose-5-phosphate synthase YajO [Patella vulgata]|uniref:1-deoxyxylulose-5-phosphate synthase YajO n=1 Tax=Patella vulgata TaxID=6465 RepID=UPI0024A9ED53|nr:1-deoxyxylulose-5-phosphate synthase YajO [Patella vulgata]
MAELKVDYNHLGRTGLQVSNLCLGTMTFGQTATGLPGQCDEELSHKILNRYVEWGGNFIDTADVYSGGLSESIIGTWLKQQQRDRFILATKVFAWIQKDNINRQGLTRRHIVQSIEESLERLQTDYVDLYQTHCWDNATPLRETLLTFNDLIRCGKIRHAGCSNVTGWQLQQIVDLNRELDLNPFISLQQQYSLATRYDEFESFSVCKLNGIAVLPWSPLKGGVLSGKYKRGQRPESGSGRIGWAAQDAKRGNQTCPGWDKLEGSEKIWNTIGKLEEISKSKGKSVAQVAIRWLLQKDVVSSVLIGATTLDQLNSNMDASSGWKLTKEEMQQLNKVSQQEIPYPYEQIWRVNKDKNNKFLPSYFVEDIVD